MLRLRPSRVNIANLGVVRLLPNRALHGKVDFVRIRRDPGTWQAFASERAEIFQIAPPFVVIRVSQSHIACRATASASDEFPASSAILYTYRTWPVLSPVTNESV